MEFEKSSYYIFITHHSETLDSTLEPSSIGYIFLRHVFKFLCTGCVNEFLYTVLILF